MDPRDEDVDAVVDGEDQHVIWGTNIRVPEAAAAFKDFLLNFRSIQYSERMNHGGVDDDDDLSLGNVDVLDGNDEDEEPLYIQQLHQIRREQTGAVQLDGQHLFYHSSACQKLYHQLVQYPQEIVPLMDLIVNQEYERLAREAMEQVDDDQGWNDQEAAPLNSRIQVRPYHLKSV